MPNIWYKQQNVLVLNSIEAETFYSLFALFLFWLKNNTSSFKMLTLTALCAYSQYEAGEARLGDPGQLPRGGGCKAPSAKN